MRRLCAIALCLLAVLPCDAKTLAEAAESLTAKLPEGGIGTAEHNPLPARPPQNSVLSPSGLQVAGSYRGPIPFPPVTLR